MLISPASQFRSRRIKYAALTSIGSKAATTLLQLLAMPLAIRALGPEQFALYAILTSSINWVGLANIGIGPGLVVSMAGAIAKGDHRRETRLLSSAFFPILSLALLLVSVLLLTVRSVPVTRVFGQGYAGQEPLVRQGLVVLAAFVLAQAVLSVVEAAQAGYQEQYVFNAWGTIGNLLSLVSIIAVSQIAPSVLGMIFAVNLPLVLARVVNCVWFLGSRPHLLPRIPSFDWHESKSLIGTGLAFSATSIGSFVNHQLPVVLIGRVLDKSTTATYAALFSAFALLFGLVSMLTLPTWPAVSDSVERGELEWAQRAYRKLLLYAMAYATTLGLLIAAFGVPLLQLWYGKGVNPYQALMSWFALYLVLAVWEHVHHMVLVGLRRIRASSVLYALRSMLVPLLASLAILRWGPVGAVVVLCGGVILITGWAFPILTRRCMSARITDQRRGPSMETL